MSEKIIPYLFTCLPAVLVAGLWVGVISNWRRLDKWSRISLIVTSISAVYSAWVFIYYQLHPLPDLPPWKDPLTLDLGLLFLIAPAAMIVGFIALARGASKWLIIALELISLPLFLTGLLACVSV